MGPGFVFYYHTVPLGMGLPGKPALEPMRTAAFLRSAQPWFSESLGSSEPVWEIQALPALQDHMLDGD